MKKHFALPILWMITIGMIYLFFTELLLYPNRSIINLGGDAVKNYFTYLYYISHDQGYHFSGMHYPYGEHIVFTDNMPLISGSIKWLGHFFPGILPYALGTMHTLLLLSIVFAVQYVYKILKHFGAGTIWAMLSALLIIFFSPQLFRIQAHYGMGFVFYIPFTIYQLIRYEQKAQLQYVLALLCGTVAIAFVHLYNLAIIAVLIGFYAIAWVIVHRKDKLSKKIKYLSPLLLAVVLSFSVVSVYLRLTDTVTDRPNYPYGVLSAEVHIKDLMVAPTPLGHIFQFALGRSSSLMETEGRSYTGVITMIAIAVLFFRAARATYRKEQITSAQPISGFGIWLWVALFHLIFAMGFPLVYARDFFAEHSAVLRQFRTIGRFIWPFYYLVMIYASLFVYYISRQYIQRKKNLIAYAILSITVMIWSLQLSGYYRLNRLTMQSSPWNYEWLYFNNGDDWTKWLRNKGYEPRAFQATVLLPYFHVGSEKLWIQDVNESYNLSRLSGLSLQTGLPIMNVMMSRTSWSQTFASVHLFDGPMTSKSLPEGFNNKPILLLVDKTIPLKTKEAEWLEYAQFIGDRDSTLAVYSMQLQDLQAGNLRRLDSAKALVAQTASTEGLLGDTAFYYTNHFDHTGFKKGFAGAGGFKPTITDALVTIDTINLTSPRRDSIYNLSVWVKCNMTNFRTPYFMLYFYDATDQLLHTTSMHVKYSTNVLGDWFMADTDLTLRPEYRKLIVTIAGDHHKDYYYSLDELLLAPAQGIHYYKAPQGKLLLNNRLQ